LDLKRFTRTLDLIFETTENEMDCDALQSVLPAYVEFEISGNDPAQQFPHAAAHLVQCADCAEEYRGLLEISQLDAQGHMPAVEQALSRFPEDTEQDTEVVSGIHSEFVPATGR
jgi:hypothetical protein